MTFFIMTLRLWRMEDDGIGLSCEAEWSCWKYSAIASLPSFAMTWVIFIGPS